MSRREIQVWYDQHTGVMIYTDNDEPLILYDDGSFSTHGECPQLPRNARKLGTLNEMFEKLAQLARDGVL